MTGMIDEDGDLSIGRKGYWKLQVCPYRAIARESLTCGDRCPMFGEPLRVGSTVSLILCRTKLYFDEFYDKREAAE